MVILTKLDKNVSLLCLSGKFDNSVMSTTQIFYVRVHLYAYNISTVTREVLTLLGKDINL